MALTPLNAVHKAQILAGTTGRLRGHKLEENLTSYLNSIDISQVSLPQPQRNNHLFVGHPATILLGYIISKLGLANSVEKVDCYWLGGLATSGLGSLLTDTQGNVITKSKSDVLINLYTPSQTTIGVSVKTCNAKTPTNDQLYFSTASAFCKLLRDNGIPVTKEAEEALKMFCGDAGFRPIDATTTDPSRKSDPYRWFWEELPEPGKSELESVLSNFQDQITKLLLQKGYATDLYPPQFLLHQVRGTEDISSTELAVFTIDELIAYSKEYSGFTTKPYVIRKGSNKGDPNVHLAPRFGFVQMQRGGQKQHPTQLQFNLRAGYFYDIKNLS